MQRMTPLMIAAENGHVDALRALLQLRRGEELAVDVNAQAVGLTDCMSLIDAFSA